jgi:LysM repeat protein
MSAVISLTPPTSVPAHSPTSSVVASVHPAPYGWQTHVVRPGDTLSDLAIAHRTTVGALVAHNGLTGGGSYLRLGQRLSVPRTTSPAQDAARAEALRWTGYTVHPGDTIGAIALRLGTSESGILAANGLQRTSVIHPGQRLRVSAKAVRAARASAAPAMSTQRVRVRPGDTVGAIALRHGVTQASILKANALAPGSVIYAGTVLRIPVGSSPTADHATFAGRRYSSAVVGAAGVNRGYLAGAPVPSRSDTRAMIVDTARRHGLDPRLALAIAWQESAWSQRQVSVANAIGVMQVIPSSGAWASSLAGRRLDLLDTQDNITAGVVILRSLTRAAATEEQAVAGYYQGLTGVQAHGMYADTRAYVRSVLALKTRM